jgi:hypothetical protein
MVSCSICLSAGRLALHGLLQEVRAAKTPCRVHLFECQGSKIEDREHPICQIYKPLVYIRIIFGTHLNALTLFFQPLLVACQNLETIIAVIWMIAMRLLRLLLLFWGPAEGFQPQGTALLVGRSVEPCGSAVLAKLGGGHNYQCATIIN